MPKGAPWCRGLSIPIPICSTMRWIRSAMLRRGSHTAEQNETWESMKQRTLTSSAEKRRNANLANGSPWTYRDRRSVRTANRWTPFRPRCAVRSSPAVELDRSAPNNPVYLRTRTSSITNGKAQELIRAGWHGRMEPNLMRDDGFSSNTINRMVLSDHLIRQHRKARANLQGGKSPLGNLWSDHLVKQYTLA